MVGVPGPGNRLDGQNPLAASLGIDYKRGEFTSGASFAGKQGREIRLSEHQRTILETRRDLEVFALYKFNPRQQLRVALANVLGQCFANGGSFEEPGRGLWCARRASRPVPACARRWN